jgi:nucleoside-diphosphate-sugar epimerase
MKKVIVTGANGFIGSSLINKLVSKNVYVVAISTNFTESHLPKDRHVIEIEMMLDDVDTMLARIPKDDYDAFYHFAWRGVNGVEKADPLIQLENIKMAVKCANVAKKLGCKKFLCAGTVAEQGTKSLHNLSSVSGGMMYGVAKHCTYQMLEAYCKNIGQKFVWMQFSNIYGPNNKTGNLVGYTIGQLINGQDATFGPALQPYDFIYIDDLIEAVIRLGENDTEGTSFFIGSGEPRILKEYLVEIGEKFGRPEHIRIGVRPDDGIIYTMDMFDTKPLVDAIGNYISMDFSKGIKYTIESVLGESELQNKTT